MGHLVRLQIVPKITWQRCLWSNGASFWWFHRQCEAASHLACMARWKTNDLPMNMSKLGFCCQFCWFYSWKLHKKEKAILQLKHGIMPTGLLLMKNCLCLVSVCFFCSENAHLFSFISQQRAFLNVVMLCVNNKKHFAAFSPMASEEIIH